MVRYKVLFYENKIVLREQNWILKKNLLTTSGIKEKGGEAYEC
jgi:hypothetical protein